jgi:hypothetical protein
MDTANEGLRRQEFGRLKDKLDDQKGIQIDHFSDALERAGVKADETEHISVNPPKTDLWPRMPGSSDDGDPYSSSVKPEGVAVWSKPPATKEEEATYYGVHIHDESNPLGLHTHVPGGTPGGGHSHGPQNRLGVHHHRTDSPDMVQLDGPHTHEGCNFPDGGHNHAPSNFG